MYLLAVLLIFQNVSFTQFPTQPYYILNYKIETSSPLDGSKLVYFKNAFYLNDNEVYIITESWIKPIESNNSSKLKNKISDDELQQIQNIVKQTQKNFDKEFFYYNFLSKKFVKHLYDNETDSYFDVEDSTKSIEWEVIDSFSVINKSKVQYAIGKDKFHNTYNAWFSNEIPVSIGPEGIKGLPGLIFEVKSIDSTKKSRLFNVTSVSIKSDIVHDFSKYEFSKIKISQAEFSRKTQDKLNTLKLMNQNN